MTYIDWHKHNPYSISGTQHTAYQHCLDNFRKESQWQSPIDIDEYPFSPSDTQPNFLQRFLRKAHTTWSEVTMKNFLMLGKPLDEKAHPLLIDRMFRRTKTNANVLVKPIYRTKHIARAMVHHNQLILGYTSGDADERLLRLNHYWGARLQNWGEDTPKVLKITEKDDSMKKVIDQIKRCDSCFDRELLYIKRFQ